MRQSQRGRKANIKARYWGAKEYVEAVCCHPAYLTYMQSTS